MAQLSVDARSALRMFAYLLANGTLAPEILGDNIDDYRPNLVEYGSELELVFAIFTNVLEFDDATGLPTNESHAQERAAQWIRSYCDPTYEIDPPLAEWEAELH
jgi:hypothetical protein